MIDDVFSMGSPIRAHRISRLNQRFGGMKIAVRRPSLTSLLSIWDDPWGLCIYDYYEFGNNDFFRINPMERVRTEMVERYCKSPATLFNGCCRMTNNVADMKFDHVQRDNSEKLLKSLLCRAFGYDPLFDEALRILKGNPAVFLGIKALGSLREILDYAKREHLHRVVPSAR